MLFGAGLLFTSPKKVEDEKNQNSRKKLKTQAHLVKINAENKANKSKYEVQFRLKWQIHDCKYEL